MDAYDRCTNLRKKILLIVLPSMVEAEDFSDHPHKDVAVYLDVDYHPSHVKLQWST
jgi:hypothetical protein